jgi:hypothetical protein
MTDTIEKDITSEGKCRGQVNEDEVEGQNEVNASPDPNWTKSRAQWVRAMKKKPGVQEGHVVEYYAGCDDS